MLLLVVTSCKKATYLRVDTDKIETTISGKSGDVKIETDVQKVELTHVPSWVKVSLNEAQDMLHYEITLNTDGKQREDSIVIVNGELTNTILVSQAFKATYIKLEPSTLEFPRNGGTMTCNVIVDSESAVTIDNHDIATVEDKVITVKLPKAGTTDKQRQITVKCDEQEAILTIEQESNVCKKCGGKGLTSGTHRDCDGMGCGACGYTGKQVCSACLGSGIISY